eukprot:3310893-Amphidinium_carterae.2
MSILAMVHCIVFDCLDSQTYFPNPPELRQCPRLGALPGLVRRSGAGWPCVLVCCVVPYPVQLLHGKFAAWLKCSSATQNGIGHNGA